MEDDVRLIPMAEVERLTGFKKSKLYALVAAREFPQPVHLGDNSRYVAAEVQAWLRARIAERDSQAAIAKTRLRGAVAARVAAAMA